MPIRVLANPSAPGGRFPRWGYLDKYDVDEYLARAFVLTIAMVAALGLGARTWLGRESARLGAPPIPAHPVREIAVWLDPPPSIRGNLVPAGGGAAAVVPRRRGMPVPVRTPVIEIEPFETGSGTGPPSSGTTEPATETPEAIGLVEEGLRWPLPDEIVVVERDPALVAMHSPDYPEIARDAGIEGTVLVRVLVDAAGAVRDAHVLQGVRGLDEAALEAAATAVFRPALQQDRPVAVWVVLPIEFRLRDSR